MWGHSLRISSYCLCFPWMIRWGGVLSECGVHGYRCKWLRRTSDVRQDLQENGSNYISADQTRSYLDASLYSELEEGIFHFWTYSDLDLGYRRPPGSRDICGSLERIGFETKSYETGWMLLKWYSHIKRRPEDRILDWQPPEWRRLPRSRWSAVAEGGPRSSGGRLDGPRPLEIYADLMRQP